MPTESTLCELLHTAAKRPDAGLRLLEHDEGEEWRSWAEIRSQALRVAGALQHLGVSSGDRVAVIMPTSWAFFDAFFGALLAGAVPVPLYPPVRLGRLDEYLDSTAAMLEAVSARLILADHRVKRILGAAVRRARPTLGCRAVDDLEPAPARAIEPAPSDLALVQFSSGTTVDPKPVALSHAALLAQAVRLNALWPDRPGLSHSGVSWLPLYHDMGLIGCILPAIQRPASLTLLPPERFVARPALWLRAISRFRASVSAAPNFAYSLCVDKIRDEEIEGIDLSCWKVAINGAEAVSPRALRAFAERFAAFGLAPEALTPVYGLSEAALAVTFSGIGSRFRTLSVNREELACGRVEQAPGGAELASLGRPLADFVVEIRNRRGRALPDRRVGEVHVKGPSLMEGYLGRPDATASVLRDGWLATGDLGFMEGGELYLTGRAKDVLIVRGRNHAPDEVEQAVNPVAGVRVGCAAAVSIPGDDGAGERLLVLVEAARDTAAAGYEAVAQACRRAVVAATGLEPWQVVVLDPGTLPRTSSGKIRRGEARRRFLSGELRPPRPVTLARVTGAMVRSTLDYARLRLDAE